MDNEHISFGRRYRALPEEVKKAARQCKHCAGDICSQLEMVTSESIIMKCNTCSNQWKLTFKELENAAQTGLPDNKKERNRPYFDHELVSKCTLVCLGKSQAFLP